MLNIILGIHLIGLVAGLYCIYAIFNKMDTEFKTGLAIAVVSCLLGVIGYIFELQARSAPVMAMAIKMGYVGKVYTMTFGLLFITKYYKMFYNSRVFSILTILDTAALLVILTFEKNHLFYTSFQLEYRDGFFTCVLGKGLFYYLFMLSGIIKIIFFVIICLMQQTEKGSVERRIQVLLLCAGLVPLLCQVIYLLGFTGRYDICPLASIITYVMISIAIMRLGLFDTLGFARELLVERSENAVFVVDNHYQMLYANPKFLGIYPELGGRYQGSYFGTAKKLIHGSGKYYEYRNRCYEIQFSRIVTRNVLRGFIVWMMDITDLRNHNLEILQLKDKAEAATKAKTDFLANMSHEIRTPMNAIIGMSDMALLGKNLPEREREYILQIKNAGNNLLGLINDILDFSKIESGKMELNETEYEIRQMMYSVSNLVETRIGKKDLKYLVDISPDFPTRLYGDDARIRQVLLNLLGNAIKFTVEGAVSLKLSYRDGRMYVEVCDTGIGIRKEDMDKLFESFRQVDTRRNRSIEGSGLGLAISRQLVELLGGKLRVESIYEVGSRFFFDIPQKVVDAAPCARRQQEGPCEIGFCVRNDYIKMEILKITERLHMEAVALTEPLEMAEYLKNKEHWLLVEQWEDYEKLCDCPRDGICGRLILLCGLYEAPVSRKDGLMFTALNGPVSCMALTDLFDEKNPVDEKIGEMYSEESEPLTGSLLFVDDNEVNLLVAKGLLKNFSLKVDTVKSAKEAYEMLGHEKYDIIFMDHMMPEVDGVEAAHAIRAMEGEYFKKVPIIAFTANAVSGVKEMFLSEGFNDFIAKPLEYEKFVEIIKRWLP